MDAEQSKLFGYYQSDSIPESVHCSGYQRDILKLEFITCLSISLCRIRICIKETVTQEETPPCQRAPVLS